MPFRLVFSIVVLIGMFLTSLLLAVLTSVQQKRLYPFINFFKVMKEAFLDAVNFPFHPLILELKDKKIIKRKRSVLN